MKDLLDLLNVLKLIQKEDTSLGFNPRLGICSNIDYVTPKGLNIYILKDTFLTWRIDNCNRWGHYTGSAVFPIPKPEEINYFNCNKWEGEYGDLRREFIQWCIDEISKQVEEGE